MNETAELRLHEEVLLLALKDEQGTPHSSHYAFALGGALLAELLLEGRVSLDTGKKKLKDAKVRLVADRTFGDPILDECLAKIRTSRKPRSAQRWVDRLRQLKRLKERVATSLCRRGILRERERRFLFFRQATYPVLDPGPESRMIARIRDAVRSDSEPLDVRTALLIGLSHATGLLKPALGKQVVRERKQRIRRIASGDTLEPEMRTLVEAVCSATKAAKDAAAAAAVAVAAGG